MHVMKDASDMNTMHGMTNGCGDMHSWCHSSRSLQDIIFSLNQTTWQFVDINFQNNVLEKLVTAFLHSCSPAAQDFLLQLTLMLSKSKAKGDQHPSFLLFTSKLQKSLHLPAFPPPYDLDASKRGIPKHLCNHI